MAIEYNGIDTKGIKNDIFVETLNLMHFKEGWNIKVEDDKEFPELHDCSVSGTKELCDKNIFNPSSPSEKFTLKFGIGGLDVDDFLMFCSQMSYCIDKNKEAATNCSLPMQDWVNSELGSLNRLLDSQKRKHQIKSLDNSFNALKEQIQDNEDYPSSHNYYQFKDLISNINSTCIDVARHDNPRFVIGMIENENFSSCRSREGCFNLSHDLKMYFTPKEMLEITKACRDKYKFPSELESVITFIESADGMNMPIEGQMLKNKQFDELMDVCKEQRYAGKSSYINYDVWKNEQKGNLKNKNVEDDLEK